MTWLPLWSFLMEMTFSISYLIISAKTPRIVCFDVPSGKLYSSLNFYTLMKQQPPPKKTKNDFKALKSKNMKFLQCDANTRQVIS